MAVKFEEEKIQCHVFGNAWSFSWGTYLAIRNGTIEARMSSIFCVLTITETWKWNMMTEKPTRPERKAWRSSFKILKNTKQLDYKPHLKAHMSHIILTSFIHLVILKSSFKLWIQYTCRSILSIIALCNEYYIQMLLCLTPRSSLNSPY